MASVIEHDAIFVGGRWLRSAGGDRLTVINPATEALLATIPRGAAEDVDKATRATTAALPPRSRSTIAERAALFTRLARRTGSAIWSADAAHARAPSQGLRGWGRYGIKEFLEYKSITG